MSVASTANPAHEAMGYEGEWVQGNLFIRDMQSGIGDGHPVGWKIEGHKHHFDHSTFVIQGRYRCQIWREIMSPTILGRVLRERITDIEAGPGRILFIDKDLFHSFECIEGPGKLYCVYAHRDPQTRGIVQRFNGWMDAYGSRAGEPHPSVLAPFMARQEKP